MTVTMSSHESSCLANCRPLCVSVHGCLVFVRSIQEASVCACSYCYDCRSQRSPNSSFKRSMARYTVSCVSRSNRFRWPPIRDGQTDKWTDNYNFVYMTGHCGLTLIRMTLRCFWHPLIWTSVMVSWFVVGLVRQEITWGLWICGLEGLKSDEIPAFWNVLHIWECPGHPYL